MMTPEQEDSQARPPLHPSAPQYSLQSQIAYGPTIACTPENRGLLGLAGRSHPLAATLRLHLPFPLIGPDGEARFRRLLQLPLRTS
jgi:hypothetical protein